MIKWFCWKTDKVIISISKCGYASLIKTSHQLTNKQIDFDCFNLVVMYFLPKLCPTLLDLVVHIEHIKFPVD